MIVITIKATCDQCGKMEEFEEEATDLSPWFLPPGWVWATKQVTILENKYSFFCSGACAIRWLGGRRISNVTVIEPEVPL